jgi:mRNA interferase RelE/StbE
MKNILWKPKSLRQIEKITQQKICVGIVEAVKQLESFPYVRLNIKAMKNHKHNYRLRVGRYRILFNVDTENDAVIIEEVVKRDERSY